MYKRLAQRLDWDGDAESDSDSDSHSHSESVSPTDSESEQEHDDKRSRPRIQQRRNKDRDELLTTSRVPRYDLEGFKVDADVLRANAAKRDDDSDGEEEREDERQLKPKKRMRGSRGAKRRPANAAKGVLWANKDGDDVETASERLARLKKIAEQAKKQAGDVKDKRPARTEKAAQASPKKKLKREKGKKKL